MRGKEKGAQGVEGGAIVDTQTPSPNGDVSTSTMDDSVPSTGDAVEDPVVPRLPQSPQQRCNANVLDVGGDPQRGGRLHIEKLPAGMWTPIAAQTLAASIQSKKRCRPVSGAEQAEQQAEEAQFLMNRLARVLSRSISAR
jgi:hypothetical protein